MKYEKSKPWKQGPIEFFGRESSLDRQDKLPQVLVGDRRRLDRPDQLRWIRKSGAAPVWRCTSEALCSTANRINWSKFMEGPLSEGGMRAPNLAQP